MSDGHYSVVSVGLRERESCLAHFFRLISHELRGELGEVRVCRKGVVECAGLCALLFLLFSYTTTTICMSFFRKARGFYLPLSTADRRDLFVEIQQGSERSSDTSLLSIKALANLSHSHSRIVSLLLRYVPKWPLRLGLNL